MFGYYLTLALRSFRRNKLMTALMVLALALGIGAAMTTLTVFHVLSADPLPGRSQTLFYPQLDPWSMEGYVPGAEPDEQMTRYDAETLLRERRGDRQAVMSGGSVAIEQQGNGLDTFLLADARYTSSDFFAMFDAPFLYGSGWGKAEDDARTPVTVIAKPLNDRLFGGGNSVGRSLRLSRGVFRIVGVLDDWRQNSKFYDLINENLDGEREQVFVPFSTSRELQMGVNSTRGCWGPGGPQAEDAEGNFAVNASCTWLQYWVQLDTPAKVEAYHQYLVNYSDQQRAAGRFERPTNVRLRSLRQWLDYKKVIPGDVRLQVWLAFGFLLVCVLNTAGLLLAMFIRRSSEISIRRALGASRRDIFAQFLTEAGVVGLAGGALGLVFALLGLWAVRQQPTGYAELAHLDPLMLVTTFVLAIIASVLAGLLPAWYACRSDLPFSARRSGSPSQPSSTRWGIAETAMLKIRPMLSVLRRHKITAVLLVLEIALSCAILCNAVFLIGGRIERLQRPSGLAEQEIVHVRLASIGPQDNPAALTREDLAALRALPGVRAASTVYSVTFSNVGGLWGTVNLSQVQRLPTLKDATIYLGGEQLLETLGVRLVAGRHFTSDEYDEWETLDTDTAEMPAAVIITRDMAGKLFPGENPLGKSLYVWGKSPSRVVGIVDRLVQVMDSEIDPNAYAYSMIFPVHVRYTLSGNYLLRVKEPAQRTQVLQAAVDVLRRNSSKRTISVQRTMEEMRSEYYRPDRSMAWLLAAVCVIALAVTVLGIVGLASFWVQQRTHQIGIRRALGATRGQILRYFLIENFLLTTFGIVLGMLLAYALNVLLMHYYELPRLPWQYLPIGAVTLWVLGQLAALGPALRAAAVSPAVATRGI